MDVEAVRCACTRRTLLAMAGVDELGRPYVHQKTHKQRTVLNQMVATAGVVHLWCHHCGRWTKVHIRERVEVNHQGEDLSHLVA